MKKKKLIRELVIENDKLKHELRIASEENKSLKDEMKEVESRTAYLFTFTPEAWEHLKKANEKTTPLINLRREVFKLREEQHQKNKEIDQLTKKLKYARQGNKNLRAQLNINRLENYILLKIELEVI